jgi:hypothetical protein
VFLNKQLSTVHQGRRHRRLPTSFHFRIDQFDAVQVLPLPPCPTLSTKGGKLVNTQTAVVPGKSINGAAPLRLGLLAVKSLDTPRTANFILWPDHPFWKCSTPDELYTYLEASFPQLDRLRENIPEGT